jgi:sugar phosphate isomerase/epimerase
MTGAKIAKMKYGVSLYSYTGDFQVTMTLEDCIADAADMGATGIEILSDTHIPGYPHPDPEWVDHWHGLMRRYGTEPTCYSCWIDSRLVPGRTLTVPESLEILLRDLELAARLGFRVVRPKLGVVTLDLVPDPAWRETIERALPRAEELDVRIAPEIHWPTPIRSTVVDGYLDLIRTTGTKHFGLLIDTGVFQDRPRGMGIGSPEESFGGGDGELPPPPPEVLGVDPRDMLEIMPHIFHIQAKFWDMTDQMTDPHIPWESVIPVLVQGGYDGYLSSEYEGERTLYRAAEMLRRQHVMLRRLGDTA